MPGAARDPADFGRLTPHARSTAITHASHPRSPARVRGAAEPVEDLVDVHGAAAGRSRTRRRPASTRGGRDGGPRDRRRGRPARARPRRPGGGLCPFQAVGDQDERATSGRDRSVGGDRVHRAWSAPQERRNRAGRQTPGSTRSGEHLVGPIGAAGQPTIGRTRTPRSYSTLIGPVAAHHRPAYGLWEDALDGGAAGDSPTGHDGAAHDGGGPRGAAAVRDRGHGVARSRGSRGVRAQRRADRARLARRRGAGEDLLAAIDSAGCSSPWAIAVPVGLAVRTAIVAVLRTIDGRGRLLRRGDGVHACCSWRWPRRLEWC